MKVMPINTVFKPAIQNLGKMSNSKRVVVDTIRRRPRRRDIVYIGRRREGFDGDARRKSALRQKEEKIRTLERMWLERTVNTGAHGLLVDFPGGTRAPIICYHGNIDEMLRLVQLAVEQHKRMMYSHDFAPEDIRCKYEDVKPTFPFRIRTVLQYDHTPLDTLELSHPNNIRAWPEIKFKSRGIEGVVPVNVGTMNPDLPFYYDPYFENNYLDLSAVASTGLADASVSSTKSRKRKRSAKQKLPSELAFSNVPDEDIPIVTAPLPPSSSSSEFQEAINKDGDYFPVFDADQNDFFGGAQFEATPMVVEQRIPITTPVFVPPPPKPLPRPLIVKLPETEMMSLPSLVKQEPVECASDSSEEFVVPHHESEAYYISDDSDGEDEEYSFLSSYDGACTPYNNLELEHISGSDPDGQSSSSSSVNSSPDSKRTP